MELRSAYSLKVFFNGKDAKEYTSKEVVKTGMLEFSFNDVLHARFRHASDEYLGRAGLFSSEESKRLFCSGCASGKLIRKPTSKTIDASNTSISIAVTAFEKLHCDTVGPFIQSLDRQTQLLTIVDNFTRFGFAIPVKNKSVIPKVLIELIRHIHTVLKLKVRCLMSDNGSEFDNTLLQEFTTSQGIQHEHSTPYQPSENGLVERYNCTLQETMKCLLSFSYLPKSF